jgi:HEAT repeat protein
MALFGIPTPRRLARLRELAESDPDTNVRRAATRTLGMISRPAAAMGLGPTLPGAPTPAPGAGAAKMTDAEALRALEEASETMSPTQWETARRLLTAPGYDRRVRQAAMRALGVTVFMASAGAPGMPADAKASELVTLLAPFLSDPDPTTRLAAARELESAKIPAAVAALEARKRVEADARVLDAIDHALREIARKDHFGPER